MTPTQILGFGIVRPFRLDQSDVAATGGVQLVRACVGQVLGTFAGDGTGVVQGELPWRPKFGSRLALLRHRQNDAALAGLAQAWVADALAIWEPRVRVSDVKITRESGGGGTGNVLRLKITYDILAQPRPESAVLVRSESALIEIAE